MVEQIKTRMSAAAFEALPESDYPTELIDGALVVRGSPKVNHQRAVFRLAKLIEAHMPGGEVFIAPTSVKLGDADYYQPDVLWVAENSACTVGEDGLDGPPDLVVEVISPGTARADRGVKFQTYQRVGVREYWIVEPDHAFVEVWALREDRYAQQGVYGANETIVSRVLGASVTLTDIFPEQA